MHRPVLILAVAVAPAFAVAGVAPGAPAAPVAEIAGVAACTLSAWSRDDDPGGLNVRAGPTSDAPVIARLPPPLEIDGDKFGAEVSITGVKDGWFRIDEGYLYNFATGETTGTFAGTGWVSGRLLAVALNDQRLRRAPSPDAEIVATLVGIDDAGLHNGPDSFVVQRLSDCTGDWVEVEGTFLGKPLRGWATRTCGNQLTTCP